MADNKSDTEQTGLIRDEKGRIIGGSPPAGFDKHPENRSPGGWDKTQSISYQYNRIGRMTDEELESFKPENQFQKIALARVKAARDEKYGLPDTKEITDRIEGKAAQSIDMTTKGESINPLSQLTAEELRKLANK